MSILIRPVNGPQLFILAFSLFSSAHLSNSRVILGKMFLLSVIFSRNFCNAETPEYSTTYSDGELIVLAD